MRPILAYANTALPAEADEGQVFINVTTEEQFIFRQGAWLPCLVPLPIHTPSTPEKVLSEPSTPKEETVLNTSKEETVLHTEENTKPAPKKKTTKKETK